LMAAETGPTDPFMTSWGLTVRQYHFNGTNGATADADTSALAGVSIGGVGFPTQASLTNARSKWGATSGLVADQGQPAAWVSGSLGSACLFGNNAFAIGMWVWPSSTQPADSGIIDLRQNGGGDGRYPTIYCSGMVLKYYSNTTLRITGSTNMTASAWNWVFYNRPSLGVGELSLNGVVIGSWADNTDYLASGFMFLGEFGNSAGGLNGNINDLVIYKNGTPIPAGGNFTPPTAQLPDS